MTTRDLGPCAGERSGTTVVGMNILSPSELADILAVEYAGAVPEAQVRTAVAQADRELPEMRSFPGLAPTCSRHCRDDCWSSVCCGFAASPASANGPPQGAPHRHSPPSSRAERPWRSTAAPIPPGGQSPRAPGRAPCPAGSHVVVVTVPRRSPHYLGRHRRLLAPRAPPDRSTSSPRRTRGTTRCHPGRPVDRQGRTARASTSVTGGATSPSRHDFRPCTWPAPPPMLDPTHPNEPRRHTCQHWYARPYPSAT